MLTATWIAYSLGALPVIAMILIRDRHPSDWVVAFAFGVSFVADSASLMLGPSWTASYLYPAFQLWLFARIAIPRPGSLLAIVIVLVCTSLLSSMQGNSTIPEVVVSCGGGLAISVFAWRDDTIDPHIRWAVLSYLGVGSLFRMWFPLLVGLSTVMPFMIAWGAYQLARAVGTFIFISGVIKGRKTSPCLA